MSTASERVVRVALAGQPNAGKTSIFNQMTGARQQVANYPGVTVEKREGNYVYGNTRFELTDLPGSYSLSAFSVEERITESALLGSKYDVVVVVADANTLDRSLVFLTQVIQLGANIVLALNMADEARASGQRLDLSQMSILLGFPVVETVGSKGEGISNLKETVKSTAKKPVHVQRLILGERLDKALPAIAEALSAIEGDKPDVAWTATKLLLNDDTAVRALRDRLGDPAGRVLRLAEKWREKIEAETGMDISLFITERRYGFVDGLLREVVTVSSRQDARARSDRIDAFLVNRVLGLPIFFAIVYALFWMTFTLGEYPMQWIETGFNLLGDQVSSLWPPGSTCPVRSLIVDGIIGGVGAVVVFLPNIALLFLGLAILEDTGYMARAAFLMDSLMHLFGLHGRSFIPMMTGFGCTIPGIMATRMLENERDRLTTMLVLPLISCGARLPIWLMLIPAFFPPYARTPMLFFIYGVGIVAAFGLAFVLRKSVLKGENAPFVMELPPYRLPTARAILTKVLERSWLYLRKAGTIILGISIVIWFITSYPKPPFPEEAAATASGGEADENRLEAEALSFSIAGRIGRFMEPVVAPMGFDWKLATAMTGAFVAKEVFVAQMGIVYSLGETDEEDVSLHEAIARDYSPLVGVSLMLFMLIATPCMATIAVTRRESGSWKWAFLQLFGLTGFAYLVSTLVYQVGRLLGFG